MTKYELCKEGVHLKQIRQALWSDKKEFEYLWKTCFGDSDTFINWLFSRRFLPSYSVCIKEEHRMVSCMQSYPLHIFIRGKLVRGAMLCGVCTHPHFRKKGYMKELFSYMMHSLYDDDIILAVHTPAVLNSYYSFGHYPVSNACYLTADRIPLFQKTSSVCEVDLQSEHFHGVYRCYHQLSKKYSGCVSRTAADFYLKWEDYAADGGKCIVFFSESIIKGYCFYYKTDTLLQAVEVMADSENSMRQLMEGLFSYGTGLTLSVKLPSDFESLSFGFTRIKKVPKGVAGGIHIAKLLNTVSSFDGYAIHVTDPILAENNGVFDLRGNKVQQEPDISISAGHLTQILMGYLTLQEAIREGYVQVYHSVQAQRINLLFPKTNCYIVDEY
jgi:predicted acetyltransferase